MDPNAGINLVDRQKNAFGDLIRNQAQEESNFFGDYAKELKGQAKLPDVLRQAQNERGLPALQGAINLFSSEISGTKALLDRLPENLRQRTAGTFTNQSLLDRQNAVEGGALRTQLSRLAAGMEPVVGAYQLASSDVGQLLEATNMQNERELEPMKLRTSFLADRFARETSGFTTNSENELNVLLDKLTRERQLNDREFKRATELADKEREYAYRKSLLQAEKETKEALPRALPGAGNTFSLSSPGLTILSGGAARSGGSGW